MLRSFFALAMDPYAYRGDSRMIGVNGIGAVFAARRAVESARERNRSNYWTRVLTEVELRSGYRPW